MEILTVNVRGIPSGISSNLISANVFQDYDAIVVDPDNLERLYSTGVVTYHNQGERLLTGKSGLLLHTVNIKRREQTHGLLQRGGVVVCFMESKSISYYILEEQMIQITNYDWLTRLEDPVLDKIELGRGKTIDCIDTNQRISEYINTKPSWTAFVKLDLCQDWKILASAYETHAIALTKRIGMGHLILLPSYYDSDNGELLEKCIKKLLKSHEITFQPSWAKSILVHGQEEISSKITQINEKVSSLENERDVLISNNDKLEKWKCLLYEKGKHQLEPVVRDALALLGCNVEPQPDKDSDGEVKCDYGNALLEVVGSKGTIKIEKFGELIKNIGNYISSKSSQVKGILVGNPFCEEPLDNRPPKDSQKQLYAKELIESAKQQNITVLLTTDLYEIVSRILMKKLLTEEKNVILEKMFNGKGLVRLI